jgi:hypothetical protein
VCNFCTAQGLAPADVRTLSKHTSRQDNFDRSYMCEVSIPVCTTIAGFVPGKEEYFVPRTSIKIPCPIIDIVRVLFPNYDTWIEETDDPERGDKTVASQHFLKNVIPYLTEVILQDGIYWILHFPQNPVVQLLQQSLDGKWPNESYSTWARRMRGHCKYLVKHNDLDSLSTRELKREVTNLKSIIDIKDGELRHLRAQNLALTGQGHGREQAREEGTAIRIVLPQRGLQLQHQQQQQQHHPTLVQQQQQQHLTLVQQQQQQQDPLPDNNVTHLRDYSSVARPTVQSLQCYQSIYNLVSLFYQHRHDLVHKANRGDILGCKSGKNTFSRIKRIHQRVEDKAKEMYPLVNVEEVIKRDAVNKHVSPEKLEAAKTLDRDERKETSLGKYEKWLASKINSMGSASSQQ